MKIENILFFKPGAVGDLLHSLPALKALRKKFPAAHVTVVISPGSESLLQGTKIADDILIFDKSKFKRSLKDFYNFGFSIRKKHFDLFVDMQPSVRSAFLRFLSGRRYAAVYHKKRFYDGNGERMHATDNFMETLKACGVNEKVTTIELPLPSGASREAETFLDSHGIDHSKPLFALNCSVGSARPARNWFPERFAELADRLKEAYGGTIIFIGGPEDRDLVRKVTSSMKNSAISAAGELSLGGAAALLSRCACLVSADTGPLHMATAVQTPVIGLYGSTDPQRTGPIGRNHEVLKADLSCIPCEQKECPLGTRACMASITVDDVLKAVKRIIT